MVVLNCQCQTLLILNSFFFSSIHNLQCFPKKYVQWRRPFVLLNATPRHLKAGVISKLSCVTERPEEGSTEAETFDPAVSNRLPVILQSFPGPRLLTHAAIVAAAPAAPPVSGITHRQLYIAALLLRCRGCDCEHFKTNLTFLMWKRSPLCRWFPPPSSSFIVHIVDIHFQFYMSNLSPLVLWAHCDAVPRLHFI